MATKKKAKVVVGVSTRPDSILDKVEKVIMKQFSRIGSTRTLDQISTNSSHRYECPTVMTAVNSLIDKGVLIRTDRETYKKVKSL